MDPIRKFLGLSTRDKILLTKAFGLVTAVRLGLWLLPFRTVRKLLNGLSLSVAGSGRTGQAAMERAIWAVEVSSRYIPRATCLTKALAARVLLSRSGHVTDLRIGVTREKTGRIAAHAWVEHEGRVIIGGTDSPHRFALFPPLGEIGGEENRGFD